MRRKKYNSTPGIEIKTVKAHVISTDSVYM